MQTLNHIAKQTLGFSQQLGKPRAIDLASVVEAALRIHQRVIAEKRIHLEKDLPAGAVAEVFCGELLQVVSNLVVNAIDALPPEGVLRLRVRKRPKEVAIIIVDNGHGIPPEDKKRIFQPFFTTKADKGTGLGLALSKRVIDRHKGRIRVRSSVGPGRGGTAFKIALPVR